MKKRMLTITVVVCAIVVTTVGTALAKGPESATLSGPGIEGPTELDQNDPLLGQLMELSGIWFETDQRLPNEPAGDLGPAYNLTWVNSAPPEDAIEERTIRQTLYPFAEHGPLINTPAQVGLVGWGAEVLGWSEAPESLIEKLQALGVPAPAPPAEADTAAAPESEGGGAAAKTAGQIVSVDRDPDYLLYLAIGGLGLVLVLTLAVRRRQSI
jgi:hypothetical protein